MYLTLQEFYNITDFYNEYGDTLSEETYARYELKARAKLDYYTQNRLQKLEDIPQNIKYLMAEMILITYNNDKAKKEKGDISSVSNDGYSVTYRHNGIKNENDTIETQLYNLINEYAKEFCFRGIER